MWRLYDIQRNEAIHPLRYENKTQSDLIDDLLEALESHDTVFLQGAVGTGKSVIALHLVAEHGKGIIQTPTKVLEEQYCRDYSLKYRILLDGGSFLKVEQIKGRSNFKCTFNKKYSCDNRRLPCIRPLKKEESRLEVAEECPYWSPIQRERIAEVYVSRLKNVKLSKYEAVDGIYGFVQRDEICPYYRQYLAYLKNEIAIVMNSAIWEIETFIGRKVKVPIEIIDEGDAYLDSLCFRISVSEKKLKRIFERYEIPLEFKNKLLKDFRGVLGNYSGYRGPIDFLFLLDELVELYNMIGEYSRLNVIKEYEDKAYVSVFEDKIVFYLAEPSFVLKRLRDRSARKLVFMSATFQDPKVLDGVFGLDDYIFCFGEMRFPGTIYLRMTGKERVVNYEKWKNKEFRKEYFKLRNKLISLAKPPKLVQVWGKKYAKGVERDFKNIHILENEEEEWSTVASRGVDLADDKCRSIILLKCPYPDLSDPILQTMKLKVGEAFWIYYNDIMRRNLIQQVGRGVRNKGDWCEVWSPDKRVFDVLLREWKGKVSIAGFDFK
jgi:Rad3-related DNA helicase